MAGTVPSHAYTIDDNYNGANTTGSYPQWETADVIGTSSTYQVHGMDIGLTGNQLSTEKIFSNMSKPLTDIGSFGTQLGDLFISTDGYTSGESTTDTWLTVEKWKYAFVFDNHLPKSNSGTIKLYKVEYGANCNILLTNDFKQPNRGVYRDLQETRINMKCTDELLGSIGNWTIDSTNVIITFNIIDNVWLRGIDFGFLLECYLR